MKASLLLEKIADVESIHATTEEVDRELQRIAKAEREAAKRDLGVWGYYHSHPNHPAVPSGFDLDHAPFIEWSYLIVSVRDGKAEEVRAWTVRDDRSQFDEEEIVFV